MLPLQMHSERVPVLVSAVLLSLCLYLHENRRVSYVKWRGRWVRGAGGRRILGLAAMLPLGSARRWGLHSSKHGLRVFS